MATVMTWGNSDGTQGRCDAKCHNAAESECDCMCEGKYHGSVRNDTFAQVNETHGRELVEKLAQDGEINPVQRVML
tara:strand:+ start:2338 stop:2565 length:228 start_codon:yes stop_codon:yes gene_type:complete